MPTPIRRPSSAFASSAAATAVFAANATSLLACAGSAQAANLGFLRDTPVSCMKQRDIDSIKRPARDVLDHEQDGELFTWTKDGPGNAVKLDATLKVDNTRKTDARTCRTVALTLDARGQSMNLLPVFCREGEAVWQLQKR